jgi:multiple sugar transport system permease protein
MARLVLGESLAKRIAVYHLPLFLFILFALFPFYWMFVTSIKSTQETYNREVNPYIPVACATTVAEQVRTLHFNGAAITDNCSTFEGRTHSRCSSLLLI